MFQNAVMNLGREFASSLVLDGEMVVLGGYSTNIGWMSSVEKKQAGTDVWEEMEAWEMPRPMFNLCAASMDNTHIIIAGKLRYDGSKI